MHGVQLGGWFLKKGSRSATSRPDIAELVGDSDPKSKPSYKSQSARTYLFSSTIMAMVLPTLSAWTEICINSIYRASTPMDNALDNLLFKDALLTVNGHRVSRNDFAKQLQAEKFDEVEAAVSFLGAVEVPTNPKSAFEVIGLFFFLSSFSKYRIKTDDSFLSGWVSWSFLHCQHSRGYQSQRCACEQHSPCVYECCVCFVTFNCVLFLWLTG